MATTTRRELTPEEKACAERLQSLWQAKKKKEKLSQAAAGEALGITAAGFNQYINGIIPLNTDMTSRMATYFGVEPRDIDPDWLSGQGAISQLSAEAEAIIAQIDDDTAEEMIKAVLSAVPPASAVKIAQLFLDRALEGIS